MQISRHRTVEIITEVSQYFEDFSIVPAISFKQGDAIVKLVKNISFVVVRVQFQINLRFRCSSP